MSAVLAPTAVPMFSARGLGKTYHMGEVEVHALRDVDLDIERGEFIVLLGAGDVRGDAYFDIVATYTLPKQ